MKILINTGLFLFLALLLPGCSTKFEPVKHNELILKDSQAETKELKVVEYSGSINNDDDQVSEIQNIAVFIYEGAKRLQEQGIEYFRMHEKRKVPIMITNFESLASYCFPENAGPRAEDFEEGSTSLENKCNLKVGRNTTENKVTVSMRAMKAPSFEVPTWSVNEVLSDKKLQEYISHANQASENHKTVYTYKEYIIKGK